jgi:hypothetical protein
MLGLKEALRRRQRRLPDQCMRIFIEGVHRAS